MASPNLQAAPQTQYNMRYVWAISLVAALGGLMFGYDWIVIGGAEPFYERFLNLQSASEKGWAMGSATGRLSPRRYPLRRSQRQTGPQVALGLLRDRLRRLLDRDRTG